MRISSLRASLNRGADLRTIKGLLGHEKLAGYCRLVPERLRSACSSSLAIHPREYRAQKDRELTRRSLQPQRLPMAVASVIATHLDNRQGV